MWATIVKPFAWLLMRFYEWTGNYGISVIMFALVVNLVLMPFMAKSKKSMMRTTRLQPKLLELQKRHEGNQQKLQEETMKLYKEAGASPMSGCLWSLIPFPILIALYSVIRMPLSRMMGLAAEQIELIKNTVVSIDANIVETFARNYEEIGYVQYIHQHWTDLSSKLGDVINNGLINMDYSFLHMDLGNIPDWRFFSKVDWSDVSSWLPALGLFLIPIISAFLSWASMKISQSGTPQPAGNAGASMKSMNIVMPLMSIWICFIMPAALGIYWIANSIFGMARDYILTKIYKKKLDLEDAERLAREKEREAEIERRREETERRRAEGSTERNNNTSKKKLQAQQKQENDERRAAAEKAEREAKRERLGIEAKADDPSQIGNRRYARGRAYDPDRFKTEAIETVACDEAAPSSEEPEEKQE